MDESTLVYYEGYEAYENGKGYWDYPKELSEELIKRWQKGWTDAEGDIK